MSFTNDSETRFDIAIPETHHKILPRHGIVEIIDKTPLNEMVFIVAPYGCGKTLAVMSWLQNRQAAWINLKKEDNSEEAVSAYFSAALALKKDQPHDNIIVIDNFHFIRDKRLLSYTKEFIADCLGYSRVIVISRSELHPAFNDLILRRCVCLITMQELSFSTDEIADYFMLHEREAAQYDILQLREETEGWPAAINVVLMISRDAPLGYGNAARSYIKHFFESEIWNDLDDSLKDFLLKTSVLDRLNPAISHAVTGIGATLPFLNRLFFNGFFLVRLNERNTYRYHRVFHEFLREKLEDSTINEKALYKMAAWWLYERSYIKESFPYFFQAGDLYGVNQVLKTLNHAHLNSIESFLEMTECITTLNIMDLKQYPVIVARIALIQYMKGNLAEMQALSQTFYDWVEPGELMISPIEYAEYVWESGWLRYLDPAEDVRDNRGHEKWTNYEEYVPHLKELHLARGAVLRFPSILRGLRDYSPVANQVEAFLNHAQQTGHSPVRDEASIWQAYLILVEYAYEWQDFKKAEGIVRRIMILTEADQCTDIYFVCTVLLVKLLQALNDPKEINALTERLETMIMNKKWYFMLPNFHAFQLRIRLAEGQTGFTEVFEDENKKYADKPHFYLIYRHMAYVRGLLSTGSYNESLLMLGNMESLCQKYKRTMDLMEINILQAIALYGLGHEEDACQQLIKALTEAQKYGYIRIFADEAKDIWPVLQLVRRQLSSPYIKKVIASSKKTLMHTGYAFPAKQNKYTGLTKSELRILKLLQMGMSYEEIASDIHIKVSTVKSHVHAIYTKLDVNNRTNAVMVAQTKGIL